MKKGDKDQSITTRKGDRGETSLFDGSRVSKGSLRPEAYGTLDEVSSLMGLARAKTTHPRIRDTLLELQNLLYLVNAELACPPDSRSLLQKHFQEGHLEWVDKKAAEFEKDLNLPPKFVLYGESEQSAILDLARAVVRRGERALTRLDREEPLDNGHVKPFINRLSDLLFLMARWEEKESGRPFRHPTV